MKTKITFIQYLIETASDDHALVAIASIITNYVAERDTYFRKKYNKLDATQMGILSLGTISQIVNKDSTNGIQALKSLPPEFGSIKLRMKNLKDEDGTYEGEWEPDYNRIILNYKMLEIGFDPSNFKTYMVHELRHALDHYKANKKDSTKYYADKKRNDVIDNDFKAYQSRDAEINARYAQAVASMDEQLKRDFWTTGAFDSKSIYSLVQSKFKRYDIAYLFPEKTESPQYKRLVNRAVQYIQHKLNKQ